MKSTIIRFVSAAMLLAWSLMQQAYAGDIIVISNSGVSLSASDVRDIFLGEKQFAGNTKLVVIDNAALQDGFLDKYIHMDLNKYNSIWTKKSFRDGLNPPAVKSGDAEVIEFVKRTPGAIGYVSHPASGVNTVQ